MNNCGEEFSEVLMDENSLSSWVKQINTKRPKLAYYSRFQVTFQSAVAKVVLNIPNYITKFVIFSGQLANCLASFHAILETW